MEAGHATEPANDADQAAGNELHNTGRQTNIRNMESECGQLHFLGN
jgi:hypothetical protein